MGFHMGHVAVRVPDVEGYVRYMQAALGLHLVGTGDTTTYLASTTGRHELQVSDGESGFDHVGLLLDSSDEFDVAVRRALAAGGTRVEDVDEPGAARSAMIAGPAGVRHQIYVSSNPEPTGLAFSLGDGVRRLGHLTFMSTEASALARFWTDGLGFRISDKASRGITWTRCDAYHHSLAVGPHQGTTVLHHQAWEVQDVTGLTKHCDRNALADRPQIWGPVRHGPGFNLATYMPDPSGALIEVYTDLLMITDEVNYTPVDWEQYPRFLNLWGPMAPPEFQAAGLPLA